MGIKSLTLSAAGIIFAAALDTGGSWTLPPGTAVKDAGPRTYRFAVDYTAADIRGEITHRQRVEAAYTRGLPGGDVVWSDVSVAEADGATAPLGEPRKPAFMQGLRYRKGPATMTEMMKPGFFGASRSTTTVRGRPSG